MTAQFKQTLKSIRPEIELLEEWIRLSAAMVAKANPDLKQAKTTPYTVTIQSKGRKQNELAHFWANQWNDKKDESKTIHQINFSAESLGRTSLEIASTVVHETVHLVNHQCLVEDCAKSGRHNGKFKSAAERSGLLCEPPKSKNVGYGYTSSTPELEEWIKANFDLVKADKVFDKVRRELAKKPKPRATRNKYDCGCTKVMVAGELGSPRYPVICTNCGDPFLKVSGADVGLDIITLVASK
jgi:hypothetical protein